MLEKDVSAIEFDPYLLEKLLQEANISQEKLSELVGYRNKNVVNKVVRRKRGATATDLLRFAVALNKDPKDFIKKD